MNLADPGGTRDANADVRRLLDAEYEIRFTLAPVALGYSAGAPEYMASITTEGGSRWRGVGASPADALRSVWPLGYSHGQGGCGHCGGMGCTMASCRTCAAYAIGTDTAPDCGVCGHPDPDATYMTVLVSPAEES